METNYDSRDEARRIFLVGPVHPYRGGIAHFLESMYFGLADRGHRVGAVTFRRQYPERLFPGKTQLASGPPRRPIDAPRLLDTIAPGTWFETARHVLENGAGILLFKYWMPFFAPGFGTIARLARRRGVPSLVVVDNAIPHERRPFDLALSRYLLRACAGFVVMSESVERDLATVGVDAPVRRVYHPVYDVFGPARETEAARRELGLDPGARVLLFFGFVRRYKGLHVLLDALPRVLERLGDVILLVAGEFYEDEGPYRAQIARHRLDAHVRLHADYVPEDAVSTFFCAADLVVQPYVTATQSGVAQIAYHFEKPVVVTDVGGLAEIVPHEKAGFVVPPEAPEELADAIIRFFEEGWGPSMVEHVREEKKRFSWDRLFEALEELMP